MSDRVVHYLDNFFGDGWGCAKIDMACGLYTLSGLKANHRFTNNKPDVTCERCKKAMRKGGDDGS